ncbi:MAG: hypothetical protein RIR18_1516 [Pseudomonadota bacterium]|jgi:hypothetical protein
MLNHFFIQIFFYPSDESAIPISRTINSKIQNEKMSLHTFINILFAAGAALPLMYAIGNFVHGKEALARGSKLAARNRCILSGILILADVALVTVRIMSSGAISSFAGMMGVLSLFLFVFLRLRKHAVKRYGKYSTRVMKIDLYGFALVFLVVLIFGFALYACIIWGSIELMKQIRSPRNKNPLLHINMDSDPEDGTHRFSSSNDLIFNPMYACLVGNVFHTDDQFDTFLHSDICNTSDDF